MAPTVDGIVSGINTTELINKLMEVARGPITQMANQTVSLTNKKIKFQELNTLLGTFQTALKAVDTESEFAAFSSSSSQTAISTTVTGATTPGSHQVSVSSVAQTNIWGSTGFATADTVLRDGAVRIQIGTGTLTNITVDSASGTNTLSGLASHINDNVSGVNAWVMNTGDAVKPYQLMVESADTGTVKALTITVNQTGALGADLAVSSIRAATDAELTVDSVAITSASNAVTDVLPGLTLNVTNTTTGTATMTISRDTSAMADKVEAVVDAYNALDTFFDSQTGTATGALLSGDSTLRSIQNKLQAQLSADYTSGDLAGIRSVGLESDKAGALSFNSTTFTSAATGSFSDMLAVLTGDDGLFGKLLDKVDIVVDTTDGVLNARITSMEDQVTDLQERIEKAEVRMEQYEDMLVQQFANMEILMGKYDATKKYLEQQIANWTKDS